MVENKLKAATYYVIKVSMSKMLSGFSYFRERNVILKLARA